MPGVGLPQQTPACGHHDAHPSSGTVWIPLRTPFCTAGKHVALRGRVSRPPALQGNNKPQTPKSSATTAKPWGYRGEGEANKPPPFRPTCPTTLPRPCTARSIAPRHGCAPAGAGLCRRRGDAAAGTVPLGGPWLHLPGAPRPAVRHSGLEPPWSRVPPPDSRSAARNRSAFNHRSINYSAALIINFLHSNPVPGESPSFLATVQRETNFPPSARGPTPPLLIPLLQTMPKQYSQR